MDFENNETTEDNNHEDQAQVQRKDREQKVYYSWLKLKDYTDAQGLNHIFGISKAIFDRWLDLKLSKV